MPEDVSIRQRMNRVAQVELAPVLPIRHGSCHHGNLGGEEGREEQPGVSGRWKSAEGTGKVEGEEVAKQKV